MEYLEITIETNNKEIKEMISAFLSEINFESFIEEENHLKAYIKKEKLNKEDLKEILLRLLPNASYKIKSIKNENWNKKWENSFSPVIINNECIIKAPFHKLEKKYKYEIIINPKMSFGTGHHETTFLMIKSMLKLNFENKKVFDIGCGTGILSILASFMNANKILSIDIDDWSIKNIPENIELNKIKNIFYKQGTICNISDNNADTILANINRNVLIQEIPLYIEKLNKNGSLILSGFYNEDFNLINQIAIRNSLVLEKKLEKNNWLALTYALSN